MDSFQYVYLVQEREFVNSNKHIYKIGRSCQRNLSRFKQYPKDSILICQNSCYNCSICEGNLITLFKCKYIQRVDIGIKYFEGDSRNMILDIFLCISNEIKLHMSLEVKSINRSNVQKSNFLFGDIYCQKKVTVMNIEEIKENKKIIAQHKKKLKALEIERLINKIIAEEKFRKYRIEPMT